MLQVELKEQGKLIVDGGNGNPNIGVGLGANAGYGGGAGGIIQIISPAGRLPLKSLSLKRGTKLGLCDPDAGDGYYYFVGGNFSWRTVQKCILPVCPLPVQISVHVVGQYMKSFASTPKSGVGRGGGKGKESALS